MYACVLDVYGRDFYMTLLHLCLSVSEVCHSQVLRDEGFTLGKSSLNRDRGNILHYMDYNRT